MKRIRARRRQRDASGNDAVGRFVEEAACRLRVRLLCGTAVLFALLFPGTARADRAACLQNCINEYEACIGGGWPGIQGLAQCAAELNACDNACPPNNPPPPGPPPGGCPDRAGDPVSSSTGLFTQEHADLSLPDVIPIRLERTYREVDTSSSAFGVGWSHNYDIWLFVDQGGQYTYADLILPDGGRIHYVRTSPGTDYYNAVFQHTSSPTKYFGSTVSWNGNNWVLSMKDGTVMNFGMASALSSIRDRNGNLLTINRDSSNRVSVVVSPNGSWIYFTYDSNNRVVQVQDNLGRTVSYGYDGTGRLSSFTDAGGAVTSYGYDGGGHLASITTPRGNVLVTNQYDSNNRVVQQTHADGGVFGFAYTLDSNGKVTAADITDPNGAARHMAFSSSGYCVSDTLAVGRPEQEQTTYNRDPATNLVQSETDALGRTTAYTYDALGNATSITRLAGSAQPATTSFTYDPAFSQITAVTDPLNHAWTLSRDGNGNLTGITDPLGHQTTATYNVEGQIVSLADAAGDTVRFGYQGGALASITDPLGNLTRLFNDEAGRLVEASDPLGNTTSFSYSNRDDLISITDARGGVTAFAYDADRGLVGVTDANGNHTTYTYDSMDRRASRTDPLGRTETYSYDGNGNLTRFVDRRGVETDYSYDGLNRRTFAGFGRNGSSYQSTISYTWDGGNRVTQAVDSLAGTIVRSYDGLDDLTAEQTAQGEVSYSYDNARRRTSMQVMGQGAVSYAWDNANHLTGITQGTASVGFAYDAANRRTQLTLPNGIVLAYTYDLDSQVTGMTWTLGGNQLGNLAYGYDAGGRVVEKSGSIAQTGWPQPVGGNTFNAANEMVTFNGTALTYDANGNLVSDGTNTYAWDARNHLLGLSGPSAASFVYDAFGRRAAKTVNGTVTQFLYDRFNPVEELDGNSPPNVTAAMLTGLGIDEYFQRTDPVNGATNFLTDTLGSTLALADATGAIQTQYVYEPFGNVTVSNPAPTNPNPYQFTGRENDATELYFYRARYYSPTFQRFVGQDPIEFRGGDANLYGYVRNRPTNLTDSRGTCGGAPTPSPGPPEMSNPTPQPPPPPCSITPDEYDAYVSALGGLGTMGMIFGAIAGSPWGPPGAVGGAVAGAAAFDLAYFEIFWLAHCQ